MAELDLALLGPPAVTRDGAPVSFDTRKATAVLALLAVHDHELSRERLAALLWPEADAVRARASLRRTLSVTAAAAGPGLRVTRAAVALDPGRVQVDVTDFEALAAGPDAGALDRAAGLYRDDFLAGFALRDCPEFDDWQAATADRLRQRLPRCWNGWSRRAPPRATWTARWRTRSAGRLSTRCTSPRTRR